MTTAQDRLSQILPSWYDLLTQWSLDGSLVAAATDALLLESGNAKQDAKGQLQSYVSQWSAGNFNSLPQIVLLSAADISGARGAYADSTDTIYLNQEWLLGASAEDIQAVLTEELGHYLDDQLNEGDTQGDEGEPFSAVLLRVELSDAEIAAIQEEDDSLQISADGLVVEAEANTVTDPSSNPPSTAIRSNSLYTVVEGPEWTTAQNNAISAGGHLVALSTIEEESFVKDFIRFLPTPDEGWWWMGAVETAETNLWSWSNGEAWSYENWYEGLPFAYPSTGGYAEFRYDSSDFSGFIDAKQDDGDWATTFNFSTRRGVAELTLNSSIVITSATEGQAVTTTFDLSAGTFDRTDLVEGAIVYWKVTGITQDDLGSGDLTGQGVISSGRLEIQHSLLDDGIAEQENFEISVYSDAEMLHQIGETYSELISESTDPPAEPASHVIRGNSLYTIIKGPSWTNAQANAVAIGGNLVTIEDIEENEFITSSFSIDGYWDEWYGAGSPNVDEGLFWIGLTDVDKEGEWKWISGSQSEFRFWHDERSIGGDLCPNGGLVENYGYLGGVSSGAWDDAALTHPGLLLSDGIAEIDVVSSIKSLVKKQENADLFTTSINLNAGSDPSGNLAEGLTIYWKVSGITEDDLSSGQLTGSGVIIDGKLDIQHSLLDDGIAEQENFEVSVYSDAKMLHQIGKTYSESITDSTPAVTIGTATSNATPIIVSGDLTNPKVETYTTTPSGKGKNATTVYNWTEVSIDNATRPLDALIVNGGTSNNTITGAGFKDDPATTAIETRSAFSGVLVLDGMSGADTITGGKVTNWLIGGGVSASGTFDALTGTSLTKDVFDLRREISAGVWSDAYAVGHAVINNFTGEDFIILAGQKDEYSFNAKVTQILNRKGRVVDESVSFEILNKSTNDLVATVAGSGFTSTTDLSSYVVFGQATQGPFDVVLPGSTGGTII